MPIDAAKIPVKSFRQTLLWPLVLNAAPPRHWLDETAKKLAASDQWEPCPEPLKLIADEGGTGAYEEAVYFHDFVRDFLYQADGDHPLRLFKRSAPKTLTATIGGFERKFTIDLCSLHLFRFGVAILTLDLSFENDQANPLNLAEAQTIIDRLRRAYPPFWDDKNGQPGLCPTKVELDGTPCKLKSLESRKAPLKQVMRTRREPVFSWWEALLAPLTLEGASGNDAGREEPRFRQVLDERIPLMTTISLSQDGGSVADLEKVREGDWFRLAVADGAGDPEFPYNPDFLRGTVERCFYDRFMASPDGTDPSGATRFLFMGYHFAAVGAGSHFDTYVAAHMRRHYRQMNLIVYLEFAALLMISSRLSRAAQIREERKLRREIIETQREFLTFTHRYRFTGVSNQLQAREMFDRLRDSLGLDRLYHEVKEEIDAATDFALALDEQDQSAGVATLTEIATLGLVLSVVAGLCGMNIVFDGKFTTWVTEALQLDQAGLALDVTLFGTILLVFSALTRIFVTGRPLPRLKAALVGLLLLGGAIAVGGALYLHQTPPPPVAGEHGGQSPPADSNGSPSPQTRPRGSP